MKYNEIVSEMSSIIRAVNKDNRQPRRFILKLLKDSASFLISQKWGERSLFADSNIYSNINCFEFEKINSKNCPSIEFRLCDTLMKSKKPLPKLLFSKLGGTIKNIVSLDSNFRFTFIDEISYRRNKKRRYSLKEEIYVYIGADNHLYIPDEEIYSIDLELITVDTETVNNSSGCEENDICKSMWDYEFICPDKLLTDTKNMVLQRLTLVKQIKEDNNPNSVENA